MKMPTDQEWYAKKAAEEADADPTTGKPKLAILNISQEEMAKLEKLANPSRDRIRAEAFEEAAKIADAAAANAMSMKDRKAATSIGGTAVLTGYIFAETEANSIARQIRALAASPAPQTNLVGPDLTDFCRFVDLIEGRAMACDGPVTPFLDELADASDEEKNRFVSILRSLYHSENDGRGKPQ